MSDTAVKQPETVDERIEALKKHVGIRDNMGGAMWWNVINDECAQMASTILHMDPSKRNELLDIVGRDNMR